MKVVWFSNCVLSNKESIGSGSWLYAMRDLICKDVDLINITDHSVGKINVREDYGIKEYLIPRWKLDNGVPSLGNIRLIDDIIKKENPDLIHIWGVEKYWALLFSRGYLKYERVLLEIQGVLSACTDVFYGGLNPKECHNLRSIESVLYPPSRMSRKFRAFQKNSLYEEELVHFFKNIAVQSIWTKEQLSSICGESTQYFYSLRPIRKEFYNANKWGKKENKEFVIFCTISYFTPFKGFHFLLKALKILTNQYPDIKLRIAGSDLTKRPFYRISDYERYVLKEISSLQLESHIHFCGSLNAAQIIKEILNANVVVNPSLVESYSAAAAEALYLGAPTVLAYAGAMVNFSDDCPVALYYNPLEYRSLAAKISRLYEDDNLCNVLSANAKRILYSKCSPDNVKERQLSIYNNVCEI